MRARHVYGVAWYCVQVKNFLSLFSAMLTCVLLACRLMMQAQQMPADSEVASFSTGADTGARKAAAALVIQEAYRLYCHRKLVKVCPARQTFRGMCQYK